MTLGYVIVEPKIYYNRSAVTKLNHFKAIPHCTTRLKTDFVIKLWPCLLNGLFVCCHEHFRFEEKRTFKLFNIIKNAKTRIASAKENHQNYFDYDL